MLKALISDLSNGRKIALSTFLVEIQFSNGETNTHEVRSYTFEEVFDAIKETYPSNENSVEKITIEVVHGR